MNLPARRWLCHATPPWAGHARFFITLCCQNRGTNQLCTDVVAGKLFASVRHYHEQLRWHVLLWLLMPDHLHAILSLPPGEALNKTVAGWKRFTAHDPGIVWQKGFFDHRLRSEKSFEEKARYIRLNPVRKNLVAQPDDWPFVWPVHADITPQNVRSGPR